MKVSAAGNITGSTSLFEVNWNVKIDRLNHPPLGFYLKLRLISIKTLDLVH